MEATRGARAVDRTRGWLLRRHDSVEARRLPAFIGHDFNIDWNPRPGWEGLRNPVHVAVLNWIGINIIECLDLEQAAATARRLNRYEFMITFAPLPVEGGTGSPVNPLAIF
jgi:kynurenine formamidase